jgi:hypothetical protein
VKPRDIYKSGYSFVKDKNDKQIRILKIVSIILPLFILLILIISVVKSLDVFAPKKQKVTQLFDPQKEERRINQYDAALTKYKDASIPYEDPQNRFAIIFMTSYVSDKIGVVMYSDKDYDKVKSEAEEIIRAARAKVSIDTVTYINRFEEKK